MGGDLRAKTLLIFTSQDDATSDYLVEYLSSAGIRVARYDTDTDFLLTRLAYSDACPILAWDEHTVRPDDLSGIILRRPKPIISKLMEDPFHVKHAADEWAEAIEGFLGHVPMERWINHPSRNFCASHKMEQLTRASALGLNVPKSIVTNDPREAEAFIQGYPDTVIVKPLASGFIERSHPSEDTVIYTQSLAGKGNAILEGLQGCPVLFQQQIAKQIDVRVTILDGRMIAVGLRGLSKDGSQLLDIRRDNMDGVEYLPVQVPHDVEEKVRSLMRHYELRFGALDFAIDQNGSWYFFEINPNGQWAWLDLVGASRIAELFVASFSA